MYVTMPHIRDRLQLLLNRRNVFHHFQRVFNWHVQQIGDGMAFVTNGKSLGIVAFAAADFAGYVNVRKEIHFDATLAISLASFAAAAFHVEAKASWAISALAGFRKHGKKIAYGRENTTVSGRIRTRRAAYGGLINLNNFVDVLDSFDSGVRARFFHRAVKLRS